MKNILWSKLNCSGCNSAEKLLQRNNLVYEKRIIGQGWTVEDFSVATNNARTVPQIVINDRLVGGLKELEAFLSD